MYIYICVCVNKLQVIQMTFKFNMVLMFCLSMWTLNQAPDEFFTEPTCACFPSQGHKKSCHGCKDVLCVSYFLLPCIEHTICMLPKMPMDDTDFLMSWTDVNLFLVRSGKQSFLRKHCFVDPSPSWIPRLTPKLHGKQRKLFKKAVSRKRT